MFNKYLQVFKISWANGLVYRLNFIMWRVRLVVVLLSVYFFWLAVFKYQKQVADYDRTMILTYILGSSILRGFVLGSRSIDIASEITTGDLSNALVKPLNYFKYWLARDFADKFLNLIFVVVELSAFLLLLKPSLFFQTNPINIIAFVIFSFAGMIIYFYLSMIISLTTFWYPEQSGWPQRFLFTIIIEFLCGSFFPLDIFPAFIYNCLKFLPTAYFLFFPMQIYLGRMPTGYYFSGLILIPFWLIVLYRLTNFLWQHGLKKYAAEGR